MPKNISVSNNLKLSRKEYVTWKDAISNSIFFFLCTLLLSAMLKNTKEAKPKSEKLPLKVGAVSSPFWITVILGGQDRFCWGLPTKGVEETKTLATKQLWWVPWDGIGTHIRQHVAENSNGLDNELMMHCPSTQWFWCNFWPNWKTTTLFSIICRVKGGPALE